MSNTDQIEYWNGEAGEKWARNQHALDFLLKPFADEVISQAALHPRQSVLDIGCGAGTLTRMAKKQVLETGAAIGLDVSSPLIQLAQKISSETGDDCQFVEADASTYDVSTKVDQIISRFGVMFFDDPTTAFTSLRRALKEGGKLTFICWQALQHNEWALAPLKAALPYLASPPEPPVPHAPGPFAFAEKGYIEEFLTRAGWHGITIDAFETRVTLPGQNIEEMTGFMIELGPVARLLSEQDIEVSKVQGALREFLIGAADGSGAVRLESACWLVQATA